MWDDEELDYETYGGEDSKCIGMFWIYYLIINIALLVATQGFDYFK